MKIEQISFPEYVRIQQIAFQTWPVAYAEIMDQGQMDYMLDMMYSEPSLKKQFEAGHIFWIANHENQDVGFVSVEPNYRDTKTAKIQKLYVLPQTQGQGLGQKLIDTAVKFAQSQSFKFLILNVNRNNKAVEFYKKNGFEIIESNDVPIGNGYFMYDYVMQKAL